MVGIDVLWMVYNHVDIIIVSSKTMDRYDKCFTHLRERLPVRKQGQIKVFFKEHHEHVYDNTPEIKVLGSGFETLIDSELDISFIKRHSEDDISIGKFFEVYTSGVVDANSRDRKKVFEWEISGDTVITLKLLRQHRSWPNQPQKKREQYTPLSILSFKADGIELLDRPLVIATLVPSPFILSSNNLIYAESTPEFEIKGRRFNTSRESNVLFFDPPLQGVPQIHTEVRASTLNSVVYAKEVGQWAAEPGPLTLVGIDTGFGYLHVDSRGLTHVLLPEEVGVVVAEVQAELGNDGITVKPQDALFIYQSTKTIHVSGSGFQPGMKLRFGGYECGGGANFNITYFNHEKLALELMDGSKWCKNARNLPAQLVLLAIDAGKGWVPLGSTMDKSGQTIANVLEDPSIQPSFNQEVSDRMFQAQASLLIVEGTGLSSPFRKSTVTLVFDPPLASQPEITRRDRHSVFVQSKSFHWTMEGYAGPLSIKGVDSGAGMVVLDPPVQVATILGRTTKNFANDGQLRHKVVDATCSNLCLNLSWDAIIDGKNGVCVCDQQKRSFNDEAMFLEMVYAMEQSESMWHGNFYDSGDLYDTCDICCLHRDEWDGYSYKDHSVCVCGSGNELSTVGADWFNEDGWGLMSHNHHHRGGLKGKNITDESTPKKRIWTRAIKQHEHVFDDMAFARRKKVFWDLTLVLGGSALCGVGALVCIFLSRHIPSRRRTCRLSSRSRRTDMIQEQLGRNESHDKE